jgi:hypothetical protein
MSYDDDNDDVDLDDIRIDLSDAEEQRFVPLAAGTYNATLTEAKYGKSKANAPMVNWTWTIDGHGRKVWSVSMLDFTDKSLTKGKSPKPKGKLFRDLFYTLLLTLTDEDGNATFNEAEVKNGEINLRDILDQAIGSKANLKLVVDEEYDNNKIKQIKRYEAIGDEDSLMP